MPLGHKPSTRLIPLRPDLRGKSQSQVKKSSEKKQKSQSHDFDFFVKKQKSQVDLT